MNVSCDMDHKLDQRVTRRNTVLLCLYLADPAIL